MLSLSLESHQNLQRTRVSMAVEARHMNLLPSDQFLTNRDFMRSNQLNATRVPESVLQCYQSSACDFNSGKSSMNKSDSGLTCNFSAPRKRKQHSVSDEFNAPVNNKFAGLLDQELVSQIQLQQSEIDRFITLHMEKVRIEVEDRKKRQSRMLVSAIEERVVKKLKEKDEEIERMGKLNWILLERVKSLCMENELWRDLAQTNEAAVNSLRTNLEQVLAQEGGTAEEAESSCGSSDGAAEDGGERRRRVCRKCGVGEARVLVLPCRHLCVCTICGSTLHTCPVCNSGINASVHVNFS